MSDEPLEDPIVRKIMEAQHRGDEAVIAIEEQHVIETDNAPHPGDPDQPEDVEA